MQDERQAVMNDALRQNDTELRAGGARDITPLVAPRSIAVIGASANPTKSGGVLFDNLAKGKFRGPLYPINRTAPDIMGLKAYATLAEVPEKVDLVYIVLPQQHVEDAVKQ